MNLYEIISKQVKNSSISYNILKLDNSLTIDDLVQDVYLKMYNKNQDYVYSRIKQHLIDIYRKKSKKVDTCELNDDILGNYYIIDDIIINECFNHLYNIDSRIKNYVYDYFINNMTYKEVSTKYNIPLNTVKRKIDKGLDIIKEYCNM